MSMSTPNVLANMLSNAFAKIDRDKSGGMDRIEFKSMYELLKPGIGENEDGKPNVSESDEFDRMDHNADGAVSETEMQTTGVLMPAALTDDSLTSMIEYLKKVDTLTARDAAALLSTPDLPANSTSTVVQK